MASSPRIREDRPPAPGLCNARLRTGRRFRKGQPHAIGRPTRRALAAFESNIDELERQSCEEIFLTREREYQDSYRHIPALEELDARYGDTTNRRIYMMSRDVEGRWLDLHRRETDAAPPID